VFLITVLANVMLSWAKNCFVAEYARFEVGAVVPGPLMAAEAGCVIHVQQRKVLQMTLRFLY